MSPLEMARMTVPLPPLPKGFKIVIDAKVIIQADDLCFDLFEDDTAVLGWRDCTQLKGMTVGAAALPVPDGICYIIARRDV